MIHGLMNSRQRGSRRRGARRPSARCAASSTVAAVAHSAIQPSCPRLVEGLLRLLLRLGHRLLGLLLAVQHAVDRVLPGRLELGAGRVGRHRKGVLVGLVGRLDRACPTAASPLGSTISLDLLVGLLVAGEDAGEQAALLLRAASTRASAAAIQLSVSVIVAANRQAASGFGLPFGIAQAEPEA